MDSRCSSALKSKLTTRLAVRSLNNGLRRLPDPREIEGIPSLLDFTSNDYLSFANLPYLRNLFMIKLSSSPKILGSGGSRLLVVTPAHTALEARLAKFFGVEAALLFNSGFDANSGFFACVPQVGDVIVYDQYIHASIHDGMRSSRLAPSKSQAQSLFPFAHNSVTELRSIFSYLSSTRKALKEGHSSIFVAVESLYSMDGTFAPLPEMVRAIEELFPLGNAYLIVDEAHAMGVYGPQGRGRVAQFGLESKVLLRLCTFGKALGSTGAVVLTNTLIRDYLLNYARPLIYTTSLGYANIISTDCAFDLLEDGTAETLAKDLCDVSSYFTSLLATYLRTFSIPPDLLSIPHITSSTPQLPSSPHSVLDHSSPLPPSPIVPIHCTMARSLSAHLLTLGTNVSFVTWPTVPKGGDRIRVCLNAGHSRKDVEHLAETLVDWANGIREKQEESHKSKQHERVVSSAHGNLDIVASKL